jgi:hypothetical protein
METVNVLVVTLEDGTIVEVDLSPDDVSFDIPARLAHLAKLLRGDSPVAKVSAR